MQNQRFSIHSLTGFGIITAIHNQCKSYNAKVRSNRGESVTRTRVRLFDTIRQNLIDQVYLGANPYRGNHSLWSIRRDQIVAEYLKTITGGNMNKSTNVSFQGETGIDAGGLRKELFRVVIDKLKEAQIFKKVSAESKVWELNPAYNQFDFCTRNDQVRNKKNCFENVGKIVAKILIVEKDYIEVEFSNYLLQRLLDNEPRNLVDLFSISKLDDEDFFKGLTQGIGIDDASWLGLDFDGLIPNGDATNVANENVYLYTHLKLKNSLINARKEVTDYFLTGFHSVLSGGILQLSGTNANELDLILRGIPEIKADDIQPLARSSGYAPRRDTERIIGWFWEIVREIEATDPNFVPQLMIFWTSSRTIPTDIDTNNMKISVQNGRSTGRLPSSHTCFNTIDLSVYPSKQALKRKLEQAVRLSQGFDE